MTIHETLIRGSKPTEEELQEIREADNWEIVYDEDSPEITSDMVSGFKRVSGERIQATAVN